MLNILIWIDIFCLLFWLFVTCCVHCEIIKNVYKRVTFPIYTRILQFFICFIPVVNIIISIGYFGFCFIEKKWILKPDWLNKIIKGIINFLNKEI